MQRTRRLVAAATVIGAAGIVGVAAPTAEAAQCNRNNNNIEKLTECVTVEGVMRHETMFQEIADANGGTRASGTPGYDASVDYVADTLDAAGYQVTIQAFPFVSFEVVGPSALQQTQPAQVTYVEDVDFAALDQTDDGDVTAAVTAVDVQLGLNNTSTSGCEAADFAGFPAGNIALLQRGVCTFEQKAENAAAAGAVGVIFFNQGNTADPARQGIPAVTLGNTNTSDIPAVGTTYALGAQLVNTPGLVMRVFANVERTRSETYNVLAESARGNDSNVVMAGAHLDSVAEGPGINDNGSGSAALLETAVQMAKVNPRNTVRFAFWGAEESGLVGSTFYVNDLVANDAEALESIALYLNFDMVASPNYGLFVYDGDGDAFGLTGPDGSDDIEARFEQFFADRGVASRPTAFSGRSDYQAFILNGIPAGGLFTGAEGIKTEEEEVLWGGEAGVAYDPCYHQACDTIANVSLAAIDINSDAIAATTLSYAMNTEEINGVRGKGNFRTVSPGVPDLNLTAD